MITIVTGPVNSGKSTTLVSLLLRNSPQAVFVQRKLTGRLTDS